MSKAGALAIAAPLLALMALAGCARQAQAPAARAAAPADSSTTSTPGWDLRLQQWAGTPVILLGEQHDAAAHQQWQAATVAALARSERLAAVVLEMAPAGGSTQGLARDAGEAQIRQALRWQEKAWPWQRYREVVMAAVQAAVPVLGGNLPRERMQAAMGDARFDTHLPAAGWQLQREAIRDGHCDLLPEAQWTPMARIQLARDKSMAQTVQAAAAQLRREGQSVLLISGRGHSRADIGVPTWLGRTPYKVAVAHAPAEKNALEFKANWWQPLPAAPGEDHCARLRAQWRQDRP
ncbi:hypothetical protein GCM10010975_22220 [Comamonas phosphati]|nr:hypothetical protein GCM10010975_22220 [Comamonas phosphati]